MKKIYILVGLLLLTSSRLLAQQESTITFYKDNLNLINPAFVGVEGTSKLQTLYRKQWTGIKDSPSTQAISFMMPLQNKKFAVGLSIVHDEVFIEKQTFIAVDFSYDVKLTEKLNLFMGIKAGGNNYNVNTEGLETYNLISDPSLEPISRFNPNIGVGFYLEHDKYYVSLSSPKILNTERAKKEEGYATVATDRAHYYLSGGYNIYLSPSLHLKPSVMVRYVNGAPFSTDFSATAVINEKVHFGATYRTDSTIAGMVKFAVGKNFILGYAYEYTVNSNLLGKANGSNEFFLQYIF
ncbi:PorP/SprF family type IX secretion system membrane protein [Flavobacterium sp. TMP13]|uniref:PorP/SprF family type IX secretion system membrane protein n=1 Tax=Flavobacterium sp. TMP13 TaxID=3425950 RepID=UPI003D78AB2E